MKLAALVQKDGTLIPKFKRGETRSKSTLPDPKQIWRKFASDGTCVGDWIASRGEPMESVFSIHPDDPLSAKPLLMPVVRRGASVQAMPTLMQSRQYAAKQLKTLPERLLRLSEPGEYPSISLRHLRQNLVRSGVHMNLNLKENRIDMKRFMQNIRKVVPYVPGDQPDFPDMIKLNTNECPYPPSPA